MNELQKEHIRDDLLGRRVKLARLKGRDGGTAGFEVSFREAAPEMRDRVKYYLLALAGFVTAVPFLLLLEPVSTILWIAMWSELDGDMKQIAYMVMGGAAIFPIVWWMGMPPFRTPVQVVLFPAQDLLSIYQGGTLVQSVRLSDIRGVRIAPHPKSADALAALARKPNWETRTRAKRYCQVECVCLIAGRGAATLDIEVAAFKAKSGDDAQMAMRVVAALETALRMAAQERMFVAHVEFHGLVVSTSRSLTRPAG